MSSQELAERSGIPLSTVNNFFAAASKLPSAATAGAICAILGVSMDAVYGIKEPPDVAPPGSSSVREKNTRSSLHTSAKRTPCCSIPSTPSSAP